jgi:hypothetical protein
MGSRCETGGLRRATTPREYRDVFGPKLGALGEPLGSDSHIASDDPPSSVLVDPGLVAASHCSEDKAVIGRQRSGI